MRSRTRCALWFFAPAVALFAGQSTGIPPEWEVRKELTTLVEHVQRVRPILDQLKPDDWIKNGAPAGYTEQFKRTRAEIDYLLGSTKALMDRPEKLTAALDAYFRMQSVELLLQSVTVAVRKYQNPAVADLLQAATNQTGTDRDKLRQYILDLAVDREQQFKIADQEAQRCRALLSRQPRDGKEVRR